MLIFGLTGGIASGKSTVSRMLEELGCPIIDADVLARRGKVPLFYRGPFAYLRMRTLPSRGLGAHACVYRGETFAYAAVVEPGKPAWKEIVKHFGDEILGEDSSINRQRLGSIAFNDESRRRVLNRCTHPYIRREILWELAKNFLKGVACTSHEHIK